MSAHTITRQQRHMAREFKRLGPALVSPEWAIDFDTDGHAEHVVLSDSGRTPEVLNEMGEDDEATGRIWRAYQQYSDKRINNTQAWMAHQFEVFMADYFDAGRRIAQDEA